MAPSGSRIHAYIRTGPPADSFFNSDARLEVASPEPSPSQNLANNSASSCARGCRGVIVLAEAVAFIVCSRFFFKSDWEYQICIQRQTFDECEELFDQMRVYGTAAYITLGVMAGPIIQDVSENIANRAAQRLQDWWSRRQSEQ